MNHKRWTLFIVALALVFISVQAFAQGGSSPQQQSQMSPGAQAGMQMTQSHRASDLIGKQAETSQGEQLGQIEDVIISNNGQVDFIILSEARGNKLIPIPFHAADFSKVQDKITFKKVDQQKLQGAPTLSEGEWNKLDDPQFEQQVRSYYGTEMTPGHMRGTQPGQSK